MNSRYLKQQMKMIWRWPWWFYVEANANQKEQVWCGRTEVFLRPLEQEYSGHAEGESDLKWMCQPGESCNKHECDAAHEYGKTGLTCFKHLLIKGHFWVKVNTQIFNWWLKLNRRASNRDRSNRLSQSSKMFGSGVVKGDGLWLGWVQMKTIIQKPVMDSLSAGFNWSNEYSALTS